MTVKVLLCRLLCFSVHNFPGNYGGMFILQQRDTDAKPAEDDGSLLVDFSGVWIRLFHDYPMDCL